MTLAPAVSRMIAASNLGTIMSLVLLELGLRAKSRRAWSVALGCIAAVLACEAYCWIAYAMTVRAMIRAPGYQIVGPGKAQLFWIEAGPYFAAALIPALVLRAVWSRRKAIDCLAALDGV